MIKILGVNFPPSVTSEKYIFRIYNELCKNKKFISKKEGFIYIRNNFDILNSKYYYLSKSTKKKNIKKLINNYNPYYHLHKPNIITNIFDEKFEIPKDKITYTQYLKSGKWALISNRIKNERKKCEICKSVKDLNVHHIKYKEVIGQENICSNTWLLLVCQNCHNEIHSKEKYIPIDPKRNKNPITRQQFLTTKSSFKPIVQYQSIPTY
jgi:hypothetical protein